jgi:hypothetical protein
VRADTIAHMLTFSDMSLAELDDDLAVAIVQTKGVVFRRVKDAQKVHHDPRQPLIDADAQESTWAYIAYTPPRLVISEPDKPDTKVIIPEGHVACKVAVSNYLNVILVGTNKGLP